MEEQEKYDLIEQYLSGKMEKAAQLDFENQLKSNSALQQEVVLHRQVEESLKGEGIHDFRAKLKKADQKWETKHSNPKASTPIFSLPIRRLLLVAASFLLLVLAYNFFDSSSNQGGTNLYAQHFTPYKMVLNQRSSSNAPNTSPALTQAIEAYEQKDFATAAQAFATLQQESPKVLSLVFYQAISELSQQKPQTAIPLLKNILAQAPPLFVEQSQWYLALAYLQMEDQGAAQKELEKIVDGAFKYKEAQEILRSMQ